MFQSLTLACLPPCQHKPTPSLKRIPFLITAITKKLLVCTRSWEQFSTWTFTCLGYNSMTSTHWPFLALFNKQWGNFYHHQSRGQRARAAKRNLVRCQQHGLSSTWTLLTDAARKGVLSQHFSRACSSRQSRLHRKAEGKMALGLTFPCHKHKNCAPCDTY